MPFEFIDHTGDTGVDLVATTDEQLFREAARALSVILLGPAADLRPSVEHALQLAAEDEETLLVDFLNELIFLFDSQGLLCQDMDNLVLDLAGTARLSARLLCDRFDASRHQALTEVKAATFHDLSIERRGGRVSCRLVFDL